MCTYAVCHMIYVSVFQVGLGADKLWLHSDPVSRRNDSVNEEVLWALFYKTHVFLNFTMIQMSEKFSVCVCELGIRI